MRKISLSILLFTLLVCINPLGNAAVPKAGNSCSKLGTIQNYNGKKFTCIKSGKKLVWNKGVLIPTPKPSTSPIGTNSDLDVDGYPRNIPAPGRSCPFEGEKSSYNNQSLDCVGGFWKSGGSSGATSTPKPSFSPSPLQPNNPNELGSTSPAPGRFCVNENNQSAYGNEYLVCTKGVWARKLGFRISVTKTPTSSYTPKYGKVTEKELEKSILANWAEWKKKKILNTPKMTIILQDGYSKDWADVTREVITYTSNVLDGNGLKLVQVPYWIFGETEEFRIKTFNEFAKTASCNPPYIANSEEAIYCATADIGSGGLRIAKPGMPVANNYKLTQKDVTLLTYFVAHDTGIFYVVQAQHGDIAYTGNKYQIPAWIREGSAQLIGLLVTNDLRNSGNSYVDLESDGNFVGPKPESICSKDLQDAEGKEKIMPDQCSQSMHRYAVSLLVAKYGGLEALFKFHKNYGLSNDWVKDFKECFGISREDFYKEWWAYLGIPQSDWPDLQPPTPPERY
jgi:hypothetical protein